MLVLRPFSFRYILSILRIRNQGREYFKDAKRSGLLSHVKWFLRFQKDEKNIGRVVVLDDTVIGYIRVHENRISIGIGKHYRSLGYGKLALNSFLQQADVKQLGYLIAEIKKGNHRSIYLFQGFGFKEIHSNQHYKTYRKIL